MICRRTRRKKNSREGVINNLPDNICCHILSLLPIKYAVATNLLSKKWRNLWTYAFFTNLELNDGLHPKSSTTVYNDDSLFSIFVNHVLCLINLPYIQKLTFICLHYKHVNSWLRTACTSNLVEVEIKISYTQNPIELPQILYVSTSLLVLKLIANIQLDFPPDSVCFPNLKVLWIKVHNHYGVSLTEKLSHICLVLEDLFIQVDLLNKERAVVFSLKSSTLRRLKIECLVDEFVGDIEYCFVVDCPNLEYLDLKDDFLAKYNIVADLKILDDAKICIGHPSADYAGFQLYFEVNHSNRAFELLEALSNVKSLSLSGSTTGAVISYSRTHSNDMNEDEIALLIRLRKFALNFPFLTHLEMGFCNCDWNLLTLLLHSSPKLEYLILKKEIKLDLLDHRRSYYPNPKGPVPECLLLHLKEVEIWGFEGDAYDTVLVEFFFGHAEVLQKMAIHSQELSPDKEKQVLEFPKASEACQVVIKKLKDKLK